MDALTLFGLLAVTAMLIFYALRIAAGGGTSDPSAKQGYRIWKSCAHTSPCGMDRIGEATQSFRIGFGFVLGSFGGRVLTARRLALDPGEYNKGKAICDSPTVRRGAWAAAVPFAFSAYPIIERPLGDLRLV